MTTTPAERDLFEAHMLRVTGKRPMTWGETPGRPAEVAHSIDRYREPGHQFAWELWQSARAALASSPAVPSLTERMEVANRIDAIARSLSYNGEKREGDAKHRLCEIVASLGGTGALAALPQTEPGAEQS